MKKIVMVLVVCVVAFVVCVSGCTSDDSSNSSIKTKNYNSETGVTSGETSDGNEYAYNEKGDMAVSDGKDTYVYENSTGKVYKYN